MNTEILNTEIQDFISNHLNIDVANILLKGTRFEHVSTLEIVEQIESKAKCKNKLPTWFAAKQVYYPKKLSIEQTSSEITANYKSQLFSGESIIDITGGFGVDAFYFSKVFKNVTHCEIDKNLSKIVTHNCKKLGAGHINMIATDGIAYLKSLKKQYDWLYIDPSRRHDSKGKVFFLNDCMPNVPSQLNLLFEFSDNIAIKTSPLLDLSIGINELRFVKEIHIVSVKNEVKELIWILKNGFGGEVQVVTVNLLSTTKVPFKFLINEEAHANAKYMAPLQYLYEPNASILKSGGFNCLAEKFELFKLHQHAHLYTSNELIEFPGRRFKIEDVIPYSKKKIKALKISKANITTRHFPETVEKIRLKHRIKDGGQHYLFFTTNYRNEKIVLICYKQYALSE